jgi:hypothetical protein
LLDVLLLQRLIHVVKEVIVVCLCGCWFLLNPLSSLISLICVRISLETLEGLEEIHLESLVEVLHLPSVLVWLVGRVCDSTGVRGL